MPAFDAKTALGDSTIGFASFQGRLQERSNSHFANNAAQPAPNSCGTTNIGTSCGAMPANVSDKLRATVIAGLAKLVDEVNQYAAVI